MKRSIGFFIFLVLTLNSFAQSKMTRQQYIDTYKKDQRIDSFPEILRQEKLNIHMGYDDYISKKDRGDQLMEIHMMVKDNIKELQK